MCTMVVVCKGCEKPIMDRYLMNVADKSWHPSCVSCADCGTALSEKCFSRDSSLYCKEDFFRRYGTKCAGCSHGISPNELVRKARDNVYHLNCFICIACKKPLSTGEELYVVDDTSFLCKDDYLKTKTQTPDQEEIDSAFENEIPETKSDAADSEKDFSLDGDLLTSPQTEDSFKESNHIHNNNNESSTRSEKDSGSDKEESNSVEDANGNKRRGPRTTIKAKQLEVLKATFSATPKPTRHIREQLAAETGLNMRVIQVWFQNRRSKERRLKQMNSMGGRRPYYGRSPRRMRGSHVDDSPDMPRPFGFYPEGQPEGFYPGLYPGPYPGQDYYAHPNGAIPHPAEHNAFTGHPPSGIMDMPPISHSGGVHDNGYMPEIMGSTSPDQSLVSAGSLTSDPTHYPRSSSGPYNHMSAHHQPIESW